MSANVTQTPIRTSAREPSSCSDNGGWLRVVIQGRLRLKTDLHIGDGGDRPEKPTQDAADDAGRASTVATLVRDQGGRPVVPGAALKGVLRSYLEMVLQVPEDDPRLRHVFGFPAQESPGDDPAPEALGAGGHADFHYATCASPAVEVEPVARVGIDRRLRIAADARLFTNDKVPVGTVFDVTITGYRLQQDHVDLLLTALAGFNDPWEPIRLGSGSADYGGRATWELQEIWHASSADLKKWLAQSLPVIAPCGLDTRKDDVSGECQSVFDRVQPGQCRKLADEAKERVESTRLDRRPMLILTVELQFGGPFLVNDPCSKRSDKDPDHSPRLTSDRRPLLPASSFRGAFRSQAERILRTLDSNALGDPHRLGWDPKTKMPPPLFELFGYSKRRALVDIEDFTGTEPVSKELLEQHTQQFVAIDRFTGGSSHRRLFNAAYLDRPTLTGKIRIPLDGRVRPEMLGLLALTFRDLIEGDITFGWGAAKGYGVCRARIAKWEVIGAGRLSLARLQTLCKGIDTQQAAQLKSQLQENNFVLTEPVKCLVSTLVKCLQDAMGPAEG